MAVRASDPAAQLEPYRAELSLHCYRMLGSVSDAEDAVQETLLRAWLHREQFESRGTIRGWLYRIATNVCLDTLQRRRRIPLPLDPDSLPAEPTSEPGPEELVLLRDSSRRALAAVSELLPARQRSVLVLRVAMQWSAREVADVLGCTVAAVNSSLQRARATLATADLGA